MIGGGELLFGGEVTLAGPGEGQNSYDTPWLFGSYGDGLNEIAARFHSYVRSLHPRLFSHGRPVILNTWEAVYFDHNFDTLKRSPTRPPTPAWNDSWWTTAGSAPAATTPPASVTGRLRRTSGPMVRSP